MKNRQLSNRAMEIRERFPSVFESIYARNKSIASGESYYHILYKLCKVCGLKLAYKNHKDMIRFCNQQSKHRDTPKNQQDLDDRSIEILRKYQDTGEISLPMYIYTNAEKLEKFKLEQNTYQNKNHKKDKRTWKF